MADLLEYLAMDGHGLYVWLSYGLAFVLLSANVVMPLLGYKQTKQRLVKRLRREGKLK
ncbi:MAG: heme exporter protein CcmD [Pontibacterium sp.]